MTFNGKQESEYYEAATKSIQDSDRKIREIRNLDYAKACREYFTGILNSEKATENNLEPQHGVTPCKLDSALKNGLPALGYAPQWALPTDCVHWEYPQESLIVCNENSGEECNLYCKDTASKVTKDQEANLLRGVSDFYKNLQTACQTVLSSANLVGANYPSQRGTVSNTDFSSNGAGSTPDLTKNPIDWAHWEKAYPGLLALPNCEETQKKLNPIAKRIFGCQEDQEDVVTSRKTITHENKDLPYDFSLPCVTTVAKEREIRKESTNTSSRTRKAHDKSDKSRVNVAIRKSDVEDNLVKNETRTSGVNSSNNYWDDYVDMSGQYPGHSRPPVGTPPPQNVWNHLTMTQGQGKNNSGNRGNVGSVGGGGSVPPTHDSLQRSYERVQSDLSYILSEVSGMNMHPTALSGASLNSAGFYTHPSIARASHLTSQLAPQLAHTQAPPTWHTPTVPSKNVTAQNAPGNPLYSLQMLVDNRQNQNQYRNSPGSQNTLDLSSTSEIAENYSRMTQDIPISLTARNVDKGSRNGNIISPPIPLNGETSSDSGISSSVPTPNSLGEPVSLSTKELTSTPKITVKNFESNLKGVANLHDKMKDIVIDNFAQKVINLPPSVTIERVMSNVEKKDTEQPMKVTDTLSVIAQVPRNVMPVIVNLTSRMDKDTVDSPMRESSSERERKIDDATSVRSPKNMPKRGKKGVDSLLEKLEGGNKKLGSTENIGSVIVTPVEEKQDTSSVKSMSPERQKSKSPTREDDVVSPAFSNDDSNDNTKQRRKRKLEKPVRLSKDSKTEVEDMELEPTEPREPRICEPILEEIAPRSPLPLVSSDLTTNTMTMTTATATTTATTTITTISCSQPINADTRIEDRTKNEETNDDIEEDDDDNEEEADEATKARVGGKKNSENVETTKIEENEPIKRRRSSEGPATNQTPTSQRTRRKSSDDASEFSKVTSPRGVNNPFNEVESELEKMFAGIVENEETDDIEKGPNDTSKDIGSNEIKRSKKKKDDNEPKMEIDDATTIDDKCTSETSTNPTDVTSSTASTKVTVNKRGKKGKSRGGKRKISRSVDNVWAGACDDPTTIKDNKKRRGSKGAKKIIETPTKKTKNKNLKTEGVREIAYDSGSNASSIRSRGPVVHVEGPRDSPLSVQVVNAPREDEEEKNKEKRKSVGNGNAGRSKRLSHQNDLDYRGKVSRAGLFSSTLSSRYDAHTTDSTWVCVFCKQGPHSIVPGDPLRPHPNLAGPHIAPGTYTVPAGVLSDLFGPYLIGKERLEESILSADEQEITTEQKKGSKNKRSLRYAGLADQFSAKMGKKKRNSIECIVTGAFTGMTLLPGDEQRWEVWLHEQCALWAAGVYMAGGRVTGLQEAVWDATKSICGSCGLGGANIGCVKRGCKAVTHYPCALTKGWLLDTNQYIPKCNLHRVT